MVTSGGARSASVRAINEGGTRYDDHMPVLDMSHESIYKVNQSKINVPAPAFEVKI